jgi:hypothetical protein
MIRMLTEGVRREELAQQQITDLSGDLIARPFVLSARCRPLLIMICAVGLVAAVCGSWLCHWL